MTTGLINGDVDEDLIVCAPGYGREGLAQIGRVYIVYGGHQALHNGDLDLDNDADVILEGLEVSVKQWSTGKHSTEERSDKIPHNLPVK